MDLAVDRTSYMKSLTSSCTSKDFSESDLIERLHNYSNGELTHQKTTDDGIIAYHSPHKRQELVYPTRDLKKVAEKINLGWQPKAGKCGFLVRGPEECLCDLSDPFKVRYNGVIDTLAIYMQLANLKSTGEIHDVMDKSRKDIAGLNVYLLEGQALETQTRIAGSDYRIEQAKTNILDLLKKRPDWEKYRETARKQLKPRELCAKEESIDDLKPVTKEFYYLIKNVHEVVSPLDKQSVVCNGMWKSVPNADVYVFVPKAGFKFALGFVDTRERYDDIMFWEYHAGQTMSFPENQLFPKPLENKKVAIIDPSFSGTTLNALSQRVSEEGGRPIRLAIFPTSKKAIQTSEYFIFLDRMLNSEKVELDSKDWAAKMYIDVVNESVKPSTG